MDDLGGVGVAGEVCAFDAMEEVHENVTGLQVVFILGWVGTLFVYRGGGGKRESRSKRKFGKNSEVNSGAISRKRRGSTRYGSERFSRVTCSWRRCRGWW